MITKCRDFEVETNADIVCTDLCRLMFIHTNLVLQAVVRKKMKICISNNTIMRMSLHIYFCYLLFVYVTDPELHFEHTQFFIRGS